ncbi:MAG: mechanosensitive ion channel domain-containing protein [Verrucomicrobiota bacterium]
MILIISIPLSSIIEKRIARKFLGRTGLGKGGQYAIGKILHYFILVIALFLSIEIAGIGLTSLTLFAGAVGVGLGFGLQNLFQNFISGFLLLIERPIKVGDYIDLGNVNGDELAGKVVSIGVRSTTIVTNDNISVIVPNSDFITNQVTNWSHSEDTVRFRITVGVSYNSDPEEVQAVLLEVAEENPNILKDPKPKVFFDGFGDSSLNFELAIWNRTHTLRPRSFRSDVRYAIHKKLKERGIEIPYPQRDIHIRSGFLNNNN